MKRVLIAAVLAACSSKSPPPSAPPPSPTPAPSPAPATTPGIGEKCGEADACASGLTCVKYYGIAGASGPQFKTCEIKCDASAQCPEGKKCTTIADGPGQVCR